MRLAMFVAFFTSLAFGVAFAAPPAGWPDPLTFQITGSGIGQGAYSVAWDEGQIGYLFDLEHPQNGVFGTLDYNSEDDQLIFAIHDVNGDPSDGDFLGSISSGGVFSGSGSGTLAGAEMVYVPEAASGAGVAASAFFLLRRKRLLIPLRRSSWLR